MTNDIEGEVRLKFHHDNVLTCAFLSYRCVNQTSKLEYTCIFAHQRLMIYIVTVYQIILLSNRKHTIDDNFVKSTKNKLISFQIRLYTVSVPY